MKPKLLLGLDQRRVEGPMTLSLSGLFSPTNFLILTLPGPRYKKEWKEASVGKLQRPLLHMMYHVEYQETQGRRFNTLINLWQHSLWFWPMPFELSEVKDHFSPNPSWAGVWSYRSCFILCSCHSQSHATHTGLNLVPCDKVTDHNLASNLCTDARPLTRTKFINWHHMS